MDIDHAIDRAFAMYDDECEFDAHIARRRASENGKQLRARFGADESRVAVISALARARANASSARAFERTCACAHALASAIDGGQCAMGTMAGMIRASHGASASRLASSVERRATTSASRDAWMQILVFLRACETYGDGYEWYDVNGAWPTLIDAFVEEERAERERERASDDASGPTPGVDERGFHARARGDFRIKRARASEGMSDDDDDDDVDGDVVGLANEFEREASLGAAKRARSIPDLSREIARERGMFEDFRDKM